MRWAEIRRWLASGDAVVARTARRTLRGAKRLSARLRSGSLSAEMDRIVAEALDTSRGSGLAIPTAELLNRRRRRDRAMQDRAEADRTRTQPTREP